MKNRSLLAWVGGIAIIVIVVASLVVRRIGPADTAAVVGDQRAAVTRFHRAVERQDWATVFALTSQPPAKSASGFASLMHAQVIKHGRITSVHTTEIRLLRSAQTPLIEVHEIITTTRGGTSSQHATVSYFARRDNRWLFAFSAPA